MKRHTSRWFVIILLLCLAVPATAGAQAYKGKAKAKGTVKNPEGQALKDVMVTALFGDMTEGPKAVKVKGNGEFEVKNLVPGVWTFTANGGALGYGAESAEVEVLAKDTPLFEITLLPLQAMLEQATAHFEAERYSAARAVYKNMLTALPDNLVLHQPIALTYQAEGNHAEALPHFDVLLAALTETSTDPAVAAPAPTAVTEVRLQAIRSLALSGNYEGMHTAVAAIGGDNLTSSAISALLELCANGLMGEMKNYGDAVTLLDLLIQSAPASSMAYYYRGMAHVQLEKDAEATADLQKFVDMSRVESPQVQQAKDVIAKLSNVTSSQP